MSVRQRPLPAIPDPNMPQQQPTDSVVEMPPQAPPLEAPQQAHQVHKATSRATIASQTPSQLLRGMGPIYDLDQLETDDEDQSKEEADEAKKKRRMWKAYRRDRNQFQATWFDFVTLKGSVLRSVFIPGMVATVWGVGWVCVFMLTSFRALFPNSQAFISIVSFVVALILGYRTNSAYDRYWEARKVWGVLITQSRNLARCIWCATDAKGNAKYERQRLGAINLIMAFAVSTKHMLRNELGHNYTDLAHLLIHIPKYRPGYKPKTTAPNQNAILLKNEQVRQESIPLDVVLLLTEYTRHTAEHEIIDATTKTLLNGFVGGLIECLTSFERIRNTPIPLAYAIHLKHILVIFLLALPFQIPQVLGWLSIPVIFIASFTLLGIESIAGEIEQPFGYDYNDLRMNDFCDSLRLELHALTQDRDAKSRSVERWTLGGLTREETVKRERVRRATEFGLSNFADSVVGEVDGVLSGQMK